MSATRTLATAVISAAFLLTGCGIPLTSGAPVPDMSKVTIGAEPTDAADSTTFSSECERTPQVLMDWLDDHSYETSQTSPDGKGW